MAIAERPGTKSFEYGDGSEDVPIREFNVEDSVSSETLTKMDEALVNEVHKNSATGPWAAAYAVIAQRLGREAHVDEAVQEKIKDTLDSYREEEVKGETERGEKVEFMANMAELGIDPELTSDEKDDLQERFEKRLAKAKGSQEKRDILSTIDMGGNLRRLGILPDLEKDEIAMLQEGAKGHGDLAEMGINPKTSDKDWENFNTALDEMTEIANMPGGDDDSERAKIFLDKQWASASAAAGKSATTPAGARQIVMDNYFPQHVFKMATLSKGSELGRY